VNSVGVREIADQAGFTATLVNRYLLTTIGCRTRLELLNLSGKNRWITLITFSHLWLIRPFRSPPAVVVLGSTTAPRYPLLAETTGEARVTFSHAPKIFENTVLFARTLFPESRQIAWVLLRFYDVSVRQR